MEPTIPTPSGGHPVTHFLDVLSSVQPLLWSLEFEKANHRVKSFDGFQVRSAYRTVWRDISERSRQRGSSSLSGKDWPGSVFLPSWIVHKLIDKGALVCPDSWQSLGSGNVAKLVSLLAGWQQDRGIYEFSVLPSKIIRQSEVNVLLDIKTFMGIPSFSIYIDLDGVKDPLDDNFLERSDDLPCGFLAGLNVNKDIPELVMISFRGGKLFVESLALDGSTLDSHVAKIQSKSGPLKSGRLSIMISALLMVCHYRSRVELVNDGASEYGIIKVWNRWRVGECFNEAISKAYKLVKIRKPDYEPCIVANWNSISGISGGVTLSCTMGSSVDWNKFRIKKINSPDVLVSEEKLAKQIDNEIIISKKNKKSKVTKKSVPFITSSKIKSSGNSRHSFVNESISPVNKKAETDSFPNKDFGSLPPSSHDSVSKTPPGQRPLGKRSINALSATVEKKSKALAKVAPSKTAKSIARATIKAKGIRGAKIEKTSSEDFLVDFQEQNFSSSKKVSKRKSKASDSADNAVMPILSSSGKKSLAKKFADPIVLEEIPVNKSTEVKSIDSIKIKKTNAVSRSSLNKKNNLK